MANVKKRFDVCAGKRYMKGTEEKTQWIKVGDMTVWDDGGISQQLNCLPTGTWWDGRLSVFEQKAQETTTTAPPANTYGQSEVATSPPAGSDLPF